jgi:hypothetical protein
MDSGSRRLKDIAPTIRSLARLPRDTSDQAGNVLTELFPERSIAEERYALE